MVVATVTDSSSAGRATGTPLTNRSQYRHAGNAPRSSIKSSSRYYAVSLSPLQKNRMMPMPNVCVWHSVQNKNSLYHPLSPAPLNDEFAWRCLLYFPFQTMSCTGTAPSCLNLCSMHVDCTRLAPEQLAT